MSAKLPATYRAERMKDCIVFSIKGNRFDQMPATRVAKYLRNVAAVIGPCTLVRITPTRIVLRVALVEVAE